MKIILAAMAALTITTAIAAPAAAASPPTYVYLGLREQAPPQTSGSTGWVNVCRERQVARRDPRGRTVYLRVPMCNVVWVGQRFFHNGRYYADSTFTTPLN